MNWIRTVAWIGAILVFLLAGFIIWKNVTEQPLPEPFAFADTNLKDDRKVIVCPVSFQTFEFVADSTEQCKSISFGNFEEKEVCFTDRNFFGYNNPIPHNIEWVGKFKPTPAQLVRHPDVKPYLLGAAVLNVYNIEYDRKQCFFREIPAPDDRVDEDLE